ncbi:ribonuclease Z [Planococcus salinus]|uniref:Ribonuclease Z n=1 Tax=Planococcus salinus TaxID=1848460 RepID=A0A3M8PDY1_9BACL|nr:ribonuclease Z [Planococcus salinus]RNF41104.1 ribonuclease Z [Planococcus salinus]
MQLLFLGTGAGIPSKQRNTSSLALKLLEERGTVWLFDCGEATQHQILHTTLKPRKIEKIFITHLHGDHIFGLPGLLGSRSFQGGDELLEIYGPAGIQEFTETFLRISQTHLTYSIIFHEVQEGLIFEDETMEVEARLLDHVIPSFGYRITQKPLPPKLLIDEAVKKGVPKGPLLAKLKNGETVELEDGTVVKSEEVTSPAEAGFVVAILGDTRFCQAAVELSRGADVLVHEATFDTETQKLAKAYGHSSIYDAALTAHQAGAGTLIANHISARFLPEDAKTLANEALHVHPTIHIAHDFAEYEWHKNKKEIQKKKKERQ